MKLLFTVYLIRLIFQYITLMSIQNIGCDAFDSSLTNGINFKKIATIGLSLYTIFSPINTAYAMDDSSTSQSKVDGFSKDVNNLRPQMIESIHKVNPMQNMASNQVGTTFITVSKNNLYINGPITFESCNEIRKKLLEMDDLAKLYKLEYRVDPPPINLHIQSYGGSLINTFYIVDLIKTLDTQVNTYVDGYSASAATLISIVGKKRFMTKNSLMLIHQLSGGNEGKFNEMDDEMRNLNLYMKLVKDLYLSNTKISSVLLDDMLKHDLWLTSDECKDLGLVDEII